LNRKGRLCASGVGRLASACRVTSPSARPSFGEIAAVLGLSRNTVRQFARAASPEELLVHDGTGRRASILDEYVPCLHERWNSGCTNAALLWQEIRARGYQGSCRQVRGYLARFRGSTAVPAPAPAPPKARAVTAWIMTRPGRLAGADRASLDGHPRRISGTGRRHRQRPRLRCHHERAARPEATRAVDDPLPSPSASPRSAPSSPACEPTRTPSPAG
jgi:hypothetical protein